jgi:hypothetical protein
LHERIWRFSLHWLQAVIGAHDDNSAGDPLVRAAAAFGSTDLTALTGQAVTASVTPI